MIVITSGKKYIDIDAYASCIAYRELLKIKGIKAVAVSSSKINESIPQSILKMKKSLDTYMNFKDEKFIILDVSEDTCFDEIVKKDKIIEIIDHHPGNESFWRKKLGEKAIIESIGAVATIIVELYEKEKILDQISTDVAYMLMSAILDNTLNFKAKITKDRDINAYSKLQKIVKDNGEYCQKYFLECQENIENNLIDAIKNDTKEHINKKLLPDVIAQLTVWDKTNIINRINEICNILSEYNKEWIMNLISLKDEKSYIISNNENVKKNMQKLMKYEFNGKIMELPEVWLRKELIKKSVIEA